MSRNKKERLFTQRELEKHIAARLMRERKSNDAFAPVKEILDSLMEQGILNANSYAEAARELYTRLSERNAGNTREDGNNAVPDADASAEGKVCETATEDDGKERALPVSGDADDDVQIEEGRDATEDFPVAEVYSALPEDTVRDEKAYDCGEDELFELMEGNPSLDVTQLLSDRGFACYCKRYKGSLSELYRGYSGLLDDLGRLREHTNAALPRSVGARSAMASTAFSSCSASPDADAGLMLSPTQRDIARRAGLSYREYADMLRDIPDGKSQRKGSL